jgi:hypothetical protein
MLGQASVWFPFQELARLPNEDCMKSRIVLLCLLLGAGANALAQEANSGFELGATLSGEALYSRQLASPPRNGDDVTGAFRAVLYPTWKVSQHWTFSGAVEAYSHPYFFEDFPNATTGTSVQILHADVSYSRFWENSSIVVRAGQVSSGFGSFLLRYDDAVNPLIDIPKSYGYYLSGVSTKSLAGVGLDASVGKLDLRGQLTNSSPANARSVLDKNQYLNWTAGAGYTIRQGLRVGLSAYHGPYLDRQFPFYFPGEADPRTLPATGIGVDAQWGHGHWNLNGEWQRFQMDYTVIPNFIESTGYGEVRLALHPRWYIATRLGYVRPSVSAAWQWCEAAVGYRPGRHELVKLEYEMHQGSNINGTQQNTLAVQFVTTLGPLSFAAH